MGNIHRVERLVKLAAEIAPQVGADTERAKRAAMLAKADLTTGMVGEFPELQGLMGRYYAAAQGEPADIATAVEMHYKPLGPTDKVPTEPTSIAVALADKLDLLTGFWAIDEKPTGSRDPFALRRAALGVIRVLLENGIRFDLTAAIKAHADRFPSHDWSVTTFGVIDFVLERLKVQLRELGARHDLIDAVLSLVAPEDPHAGGKSNSRDLVQITQRAEALSSLLSSADGQNLLAGYKRGTNILAAEEKKDGKAYAGAVHQELLRLQEETALAFAVDAVHASVSNHVGQDDYKGAMAELATLRTPVDDFFTAVLVNDEDAAVRANRLNLLARLRDTMHLVADFSKVAG